MDAHRNRPPHAVMTMMTFITDAPQTCGIVEKNRKGLVIGFHEKSSSPPGNLANAAVYIIEPEVINFIESLRLPVLDFSTNIVPHFLGKIFTYHNDVYHRDIGTLASLAQAQLEFPMICSALRLREIDSNDPWEAALRRTDGHLARDFVVKLGAAFKLLGRS
jgi:mannose-1-phosphate guanylyltransferase